MGGGAGRQLCQISALSQAWLRSNHGKTVWEWHNPPLGIRGLNATLYRVQYYCFIKQFGQLPDKEPVSTPSITHNNWPLLIFRSSIHILKLKVVKVK